MFGGEEVETEQHWLSKTPVWEFRGVDLAGERRDTSFDFVAYTDGSKSDLGVGYGAVIYTPNNRFEFKEKLSDNCTVYQAELSAIRHAAQFFLPVKRRF